MSFHTAESNLILDCVSENQKIIRGGKDLDIQRAIHYAFPNATDYETFGFKQIGNDLQIKKINYF
ncbi:hypothetical protein NEF87_001677 [Candidatus Lokiarchaeum ossiferum]|uniref:Uncharacterized protein n=1 Tax=Candidatus Lokiarchaeum ossiferum TaxID=2951803 RepID=A0ABY6HPG6_9ARCH|nr:hypothetical protein NEF87_001677 [Candidatus Lokiarchaeum sp. B-35]